ncbi:phage tail protein, partial [Clostridium perfringens]
MSRIIGCQQLHIAELTKDDNSGVQYGSVTPVPSLISIEITDNTENVTFYSDDQIEQVIPAYSGKEVTIELG